MLIVKFTIGKKNTFYLSLYLKCVLPVFAPRLFSVTDTVTAKEPVSFSICPCTNWRGEGVRSVNISRVDGSMKDGDRKKPISYVKSDRCQWMTFIFSLYFIFYLPLLHVIFVSAFPSTLLQVCLLSLFIASISVCAVLGGGGLWWSNGCWSKHNIF